MNMSDYAWICLNISDYTAIWKNMPIYALVILCLLESGVTYGLNKHEAVFLKRQNWFSL